MKTLSSVLLSFVFVVALGAAATAGTYIDDEENDAYQASNTSLDPQPTRIDIKRAKFTEKRTKFKFKVETYQPVDMVVFCTAADCEDHADKGYLDIDFFTQKKDGGTKRHYFIEVRSADGGMEATLRELTKKGSEIVTLLPVGGDAVRYSVVVPRKLLVSMNKGATIRWNSRSVYWWDPAEAGDYCNYDELFAYSNACVDLVPNNKNAKVELTK